MSRPVFDDGRVHVMREKCSTCVFRPGNLMSLRDGRLKEIITENRENQAALTCHKTTYEQADQEAICRGYFDSYRTDYPLNLAVVMGLIEEVDP